MWFNKEHLENPTATFIVSNPVHIKSLHIPNLGNADYVRKFSVSNDDSFLLSHYHYTESAKQYALSRLADGKLTTIIPTGPDAISGLCFLQLNQQEKMIVSKGDKLMMLDSQGKETKTHPHLEMPNSTVCMIDAKNLACASIYPDKDGKHKITLVDVTTEGWQISRSMNLSLGWKEMYSIWATQFLGETILVLCSWKDEGFAAINVDDGRLRWKVDIENSTFHVDAGTACTDDKNRLYISSMDQHRIYEVNMEDGSINALIDLKPTIFWPMCIQVHKANLYVVHVDINELLKAKRRKWVFSIYELK